MFEYSSTRKLLRTFVVQGQDLVEQQQAPDLALVGVSNQIVELDSSGHLITRFGQVYTGANDSPISPGWRGRFVALEGSPTTPTTALRKSAAGVCRF